MMGGKGRKKRKFLKAERPLKRGRPQRETRPPILIVCEGGKTEPNYFNGFTRFYDLTSVQVVIVGGDKSGITPKKVVEYAKDRHNKPDCRDLDIENKNVWCVFDRDKHDYFFEALQQAKDNGFGVGFSNPSFELWLLLHFSYQTAHIERDKVTSKLKKHIPKYEKNMGDIFEVTIEKLEDAMKSAPKLRDKHIGDGNQETHNPSTSVDLLVLFLRQFVVQKEDTGCHD